jgi:hypothetical protein
VGAVRITLYLIVAFLAFNAALFFLDGNNAYGWLLALFAVAVYGLVVTQPEETTKDRAADLPQGCRDILVAVARLGGDAYSHPIQRYLKDELRHDIPLSTINRVLERLEAGGYLTADWVAVDAQTRGGTLRLVYQLTALGTFVLGGGKEA